MTLLGQAKHCAVGETGNNLMRTWRRDQRRLCDRLEPWDAKSGEVLYEPGDIVNYAFFPCDRAIASFRVVLAEGRTAEIAVVGRERAIGGAVSEEQLPAYAGVIVQVTGRFHRIASSDLARLKRELTSFNNLSARYAERLLAQIVQFTACNAAHSIEQRTAKWILAAIDRTGDPQISLTQEQLAGLLGIGRTYISRVIQRIKGESKIAMRRGRLAITDAKALERLACDCKQLVRQHFDELVRGLYPREDDTQAAPRI